MRITSKEKKFKNYVNYLMVARSQQGVLESEADFIAGAGAVFAFMNRMDLVSPFWIFNLFGGRSLVEELIKDADGKEKYQRMINWLTDNEKDCPAHCK